MLVAFLVLLLRMTYPVTFLPPRWQKRKTRIAIGGILVFPSNGDARCLGNRFLAQEVAYLRLGVSSAPPIVTTLH